MADIYERPGVAMAHVGGPMTWFVTPGEVVELRMVDGLFDTAVDAARTLGASYFIRKQGNHIYAPGNKLLDSHTIWRAYRVLPWPVVRVRVSGTDRNNQYEWVKDFVCESIDAAVMWALAKGASS